MNVFFKDVLTNRNVLAWLTVLLSWNRFSWYVSTKSKTQGLQPKKTDMRSGVRGLWPQSTNMTLVFGQGEFFRARWDMTFYFGARYLKKSFQTMTHGVSFAERDSWIFLHVAFSCLVIKPQTVTRLNLCGGVLFPTPLMIVCNLWGHNLWWGVKKFRLGFLRTI